MNKRYYPYILRLKSGKNIPISERQVAFLDEVTRGEKFVSEPFNMNGKYIRTFEDILGIEEFESDDGLSELRVLPKRKPSRWKPFWRRK